MKNNDQTRGERAVDIIVGAIAILSMIGFPLLCAAVVIEWWS